MSKGLHPRRGPSHTTEKLLTRHRGSLLRDLRGCTLPVSHCTGLRVHALPVGHGTSFLRDRREINNRDELHLETNVLTGGAPAVRFQSVTARASIRFQSVTARASWDTQKENKQWQPGTPGHGRTYKRSVETGDRDGSHKGCEDKSSKSDGRGFHGDDVERCRYHE